MDAQVKGAKVEAAMTEKAKALQAALALDHEVGRGRGD
jgi:hypothetical protein